LLDASKGDNIMSSDMDSVIAELEAQQERLRCESFDHNNALAIGNRLIELATIRDLSVAVDIMIGDQQVFRVARPGTNSENDWWIARKIRSVKKFGDSSFLLGRRHEAAGTDFNEETGLDFSEYVAHGGCFPIRLHSGDFVGTVTVSGLPQADDHALVVEVLSEFFSQASTTSSSSRHADLR
jgi:uncharacterized protein (UPF0303 family)